MRSLPRSARMPARSPEMKMVWDRSRRFRERPHYDLPDLDAECERIVRKLLEGRHGRVEYPISTDDLWVLLQGDTDDVDIVDLSGEGAEVHGLTVFRRQGKPHVKIDAGLAGDERRANRLRTTLTHEYGHVKFHGFLFAMVELESARLFDDGTPLISRDPVCKRDAIEGNSADWMEWQAGYVSGALLMPAMPVRQSVLDVCGSIGVPLARTDPRALTLTNTVQERFAVSEEAARYRLSKLGYVAPAPGTVALPL